MIGNNGRTQHIGQIREIGDKFLPGCTCGHKFKLEKHRYRAMDEYENHRLSMNKPAYVKVGLQDERKK